MDENNGGRRLICPICGAEFEPKTHAAKYCSEECRRKGRNQTRRNWERRSGYLEKQREHMRLIRDQRTEEERAEAERLERKRITKARREATRRANKERDELLYRAEQGDALAKLTLARTEGGNTSAEYWEAFKAYDIAYNESVGRQSTTTVNNISVNNELFGLAVSMSIDELKGIIIRSGSEGKGNAT